jgi:hypothetical protein
MFAHPGLGTKPKPIRAIPVIRGQFAPSFRAKAKRFTEGNEANEELALTLWNQARVPLRFLRFLL